MSIKTYQTPEVRTLLDEIGVGKILDYSYGILCPPLAATDDDWLGWDKIGHIALCLLRNHLREWLEDEPRGDPPSMAILDGEKVWGVEKGKYDDDEPFTWYHDYDEALLAEVKAAKEDDDG